MVSNPGPALSPADAGKRAAAIEACTAIKDGMILGLGTGSTVQFALEEIGRRCAAGLKVQGIPTSVRTETEAKRLKIPLTTLEAHPLIDLAIDGADELDARLNLIKGGGGALVREKVVAKSSKRVIIIADESKFVQQLGSTFPVPVEFVPFARPLIDRTLRGMGAVPTLRVKDGATYVTDNGNWILDARFPGIPDPTRREREISVLPAVVDCGIFTNLADAAYLGSPTGVRRIDRSS